MVRAFDDQQMLASMGPPNFLGGDRFGPKRVQFPLFGFNGAA